MATIVQGERVGRNGAIRTGTSAAIFDPTGTKLLLTQRTDNGQWCLPGGMLDAGESVTEGCVREVWEETGLEVEVTHLVGIYSNPHMLVTYADGNSFQFVSLCFGAKVVGGALGLSHETLAYGYYTQDEIAQMDLMLNHVQRIADVYARQATPFIR